MVKRLLVLGLGVLSCSQISDVEYPLVRRTPMVLMVSDPACLLKCDAVCDICLSSREDDFEVCEIELSTCYDACPMIRKEESK